MSEKVHCVPRSPQPGHRVNNPTDNPDACKAIDEFLDRYNQRPFRTLSEELAGAARHGGGAYFARHVAREIVKAGLARRAELQVAYAIGVAESVSLLVETFGTGDPVAAPDYAARFDFRPAAMTVQITGRSFRLNEAALQRGRNPAATTTTTAPAETAPRVETQP